MTDRPSLSDRWQVGDRVWLALREPGHRQKYRVEGVVEGFESFGGVRGVRVRFDQPFAGTDYCTATAAELHRV